MIHLTDGLDAQYNILKERVELMRLAGKHNHDYKYENIWWIALQCNQISIGCNNIISFFIDYYCISIFISLFYFWNVCCWWFRHLTICYHTHFNIAFLSFFKVLVVSFLLHWRECHDLKMQFSWNLAVASGTHDLCVSISWTWIMNF